MSSPSSNGLGSRSILRLFTSARRAHLGLSVAKAAEVAGVSEVELEASERAAPLKRNVFARLAEWNGLPAEAFEDRASHWRRGS